MDRSLTGSFIHGIFQARILEWVAFSFSAGMLSRFSRVQLCGTPWTVAHQAPLSMRFSRQEHCISFSRVSSLPKDRTCASEVSCTGGRFFTTSIILIFLTQGSNPHPLHWQMDSLPLSHQGSPQYVYANLNHTPETTVNII